MKDIQHALGLLFLAILSLLGQGDALTVGHGIGDLNATDPPTQAYMSGAYNFPSDLSGSGGGTFVSSALTSGSGNVSIFTVPDSISKSHGSVNITTSWTLTTVVDTITTTEVIAPTTTINIITELSTIESTTTKTAIHASTTQTLTFVVIVGYSTETIYTTTQLNPPTEIDYTRTMTRTSTSEQIVVPTDVTYTVTSLPPTSPPGAARVNERRLDTVQTSFRDATAVGAPDTTSVSGQTAPMITGDGVFDGNYSETVTIPGVLPVKNATALTLTDNNTATLSASLLRVTDAPSSLVLRLPSVNELPPFPNTTSTGDDGVAISVAAIADSVSSSVGSASTTTVTGIWNGRNTTLTEIVFHTPSSRTLVGTSVLVPTSTSTRNATVTFTVVKQTHKTPTPTPMYTLGGGSDGGDLGGTPATATAATGRPKSRGVRSVAIDVLSTLAAGFLLFAHLV